jgi:8-oxo-dGTP diphosphatase
MDITKASAVFLIADYNGKIPLLYRINTGWMDEYWGMISGRVENNEDIMSAVIRESEEEAGLKLCSGDLKLVHICNRYERYKVNTSDEYHKIWYDFYFYTNKIKQKPKNIETNKHSKLKMFDLDNLPENFMKHSKFAMDAYFKNKILSSYGFKK